MTFTTWLLTTLQYGCGTLIVLGFLFASLWLCWKIIVLREWWWLALLIACKRHKGELFAIYRAYELALESWNRRNKKTYIGLRREQNRAAARLAGRAATIRRLMEALDEISESGCQDWHFQNGDCRARNFQRGDWCPSCVAAEAVRS